MVGSHYVKNRLTGRVGYRAARFSSKLVLQVEVEELIRESSGRVGEISWPLEPPPGHPDPGRWAAQQALEQERKFKHLRLYYRDATEKDMRELARMGRTLSSIEPINYLQKQERNAT